MSVQHEKYTSQLQLGMKALEAKDKQQLQRPEPSVKLQDKAERRAGSLTGEGGREEEGGWRKGSLRVFGY